MKHKHCKTKIRLRRNASKRTGNTIVALFIGILVGLGVALTVALYINFSQLPFLTKVVGHIVHPGKKTEDRRPVQLVQGVDILGGRPFPSEEDDNTTQGIDVGAPVEQINFYENFANKNSSAENKFSEKIPSATVHHAGEENEISDKHAERVTANMVSNDKQVFYVLIGSFRSIEKADNTRARLALAGISASIHGIIDANSQTIIHQLRIGPFNSQQQAEDAREQLRLHSLAGEIVTD